MNYVQVQVLCQNSGYLDSISMDPCVDPKIDPSGLKDGETSPHQQLLQHATEQWRQCEWWRQRINNSPTPPIITVDDLLSFRSCCYVLDARSSEEFADCHFQSSIHVKDADVLDLLRTLPQELVMLDLRRFRCVLCVVGRCF